MPGNEVSDSGRSGAREGAIRDFVLEGLASGRLGPGARLPTEREFAERFSVPRSGARRALAALETEGLIVRAVGRGTFVADSLERATSAEVVSEGNVSPAQIMEARIVFEPALAEMVVANGTPADFARMATCLERAESARSLEEFEMWDAALHRAIAAAAHNPLVERFFGIVHALREQAEWGELKRRSLTPERRLAYQQDHREIVEALTARDAVRAREVLSRHLRRVRHNLVGY